jgi:hypothetical protein
MRAQKTKYKFEIRIPDGKGPQEYLDVDGKTVLNFIL